MICESEVYLFPMFFHRSPLERCFLYPGKNCDSPLMGAQNSPIDGPLMGHRWAMAKRSADHRWVIDGNAMVHRWPMDGLPWDPNSGPYHEVRQNNTKKVRILIICEFWYTLSHFCNFPIDSVDCFAETVKRQNDSFTVRFLKR